MDLGDVVLRKRPGLALDFPDNALAKGFVATVTADSLGVGPVRYLTVDEVALLAALEAPRALPPGLRQHVRDCDRVLALLILDGLVEVKRGGRFVHGALAIEPAGAPELKHDPADVRRVSELALHYSLALRHLPPAALAARLYAFNSLPRTRPNAGDPVARFAEQTGIDADNPSPKIGGLSWNIQVSRGWLYFRRGTSHGSAFKIYLSAHQSDIRKVIDGFAEALGRDRGAVFKIAFPAESLVRADKIVAYVATFAALQQTISRLVKARLQATIQAVPFSAHVPGAPLLSWGVDPPALNSGKGASWRTWVARQVAECAHRTPPGAPPEALDHLRAALLLRDIDPVDWLPRQELLSRKWSLDL